MKLKDLFRRERLEHELDEELEFHLHARAQALAAEGVPAPEARRRAHLELGARETHKHAMRGVRGLGWVDDLLADLRYGARTLRRSPAFTLVAAGSLALAIGANTNVFSVANQLLYMRLQVPHPDELRVLSVAGPSPSVAHSTWGSSISENGRSWLDSIPYPAFKQLEASSHTTAGLAGYKDLGEVSATAAGEARPMSAEVVSGNLYSVMGVKPQLGRPILPADEGAAGTGAVVVLSDRAWKTVWGARGDVLGQSMRVNGNVVTIVGVNPPGFTGPDSTTSSPDLFLPISLVTRLRPAFSHGDYIQSAKVWWVSLLARARPGVSDDAVAAELSVLLDRSVRAAEPLKQGDHIPRFQVNDGSRGPRFFDSERTPLLVLLALTGLVLLLACTNIANLLLARTAARAREMQVRLALGAGRGRILRQVLAESLLLAALGGLVGLLLGWGGRNWLVKLYIGRRYITEPIQVRFDWRVFAVTAAVTIGTGLLFGILPAWRATRSDPGASRLATARGGSSRRSLWTGKLLLSFQLAISTLLVAGAALFARTLWNLHHADPGFPTAHLLEFDLQPPSQRYTGPAVSVLLQQVQARLRALPGLGGMAMAEPALLDNSSWSSDFIAEGQPRPKNTDVFTFSRYSTVSPGFLSAMGIPLLRGRDLLPADTATATPVSVLNQSAAQTFFPGVDPLGRRFKTNDDPESKQPPVWYTVVGICADTAYTSLQEPRAPLHFDAVAQNRDLTGATFLVRTTVPPGELIPSIRRAVAGIDPDLPVMDIRTLDEQLGDSFRQQQLIATLAAGFGLLALVLASIGIYGLMTYTVTQRTQEIGIRLALGARRAQVRGAVLGEVCALVAAGLVCGVVGVVGAIRALRDILYAPGSGLGHGLLFGLQGYSPGSLLFTGGVLAAVSLLAAWLPAARASRVEPMEALRHE